MTIQPVFDFFQGSPLNDTQDSPPRLNIKKVGGFKSPEAKGIEAALTRIPSKPFSAKKPLSFESPGFGTGVGPGVKRKLSLSEEPDAKRQALVEVFDGEAKTPVKCRVSFTRNPEITSVAVTQLNFEAMEKKIQGETKPKAPPPTPSKARARSSLLPSLPPSPFETVSKNAQNGVLLFQGQYLSLSFLDNGSYMDIYTTEGLPKRVIKVFNSKMSASSPIFLKKCMRTALYSYKAIQNLGLRVATIHNAETALEDCYYDQEQIAYKVDVLNPSHLEQARQFFIAFLQNKEKILFDLLPSNLRVTEEGIVTLIDFVEEDDDSWDIFCKHALEKWCQFYMSKTDASPEAALKFLNQFTKGFEKHGFDLAWNEEISSTPFNRVKHFTA